MTTECDISPIKAVELNSGNEAIVGEIKKEMEGAAGFPFIPTDVVISGTSGLLIDFLYTSSTDGALDTSFSSDGMVTNDVSGANEGFNAVTTLSNGQSLAAGWSGNDIAVAKYNTNGSLDTGFGTYGIKVVNMASGVTSKAYAIAVQSDGKIVVAGISGSDFAIVRLNTDGSLDTSFDSDGKQTVNVASGDKAYAVSIASSGKTRNGDAPSFNYNLTYFSP